MAAIATMAATTKIVILLLEKISLLAVTSMSVNFIQLVFVKIIKANRIHNNTTIYL